MKFRIFAAAAACLLSAALLGGCADTPSPVPTPADTAAVTDAAPTETDAATSPTDPTPTQPSVDTAHYNRLTGEFDNPAGASSRAIGVMIGNNTKSRPQTGIWKADMFVEAETEGGITRIMAVFADASRVPAQLCPIRSARSPFVLMAGALDLIYVHAGGSVAGLQTVKTTGINSINALTDGTTFWRDAALRASRGTEYSLCTSGERLAARIEDQGWRTASDRAPFSFGGETGGDPCARLQVSFSGSQSDCFVYDAETDLYTKYVGKLGSASVHVDASGSALKVANVVIMYDTKYAENDTTINFRLSSGEGVLVSGGKARTIRWSRSAGGLSFTENGEPAVFLPGKTYICLVAQANKAGTVIQ